MPSYKELGFQCVLAVASLGSLYSLAVPSTFNSDQVILYFAGGDLVEFH